MTTEPHIVFELNGIEHCLPLDEANDLLIACVERALAKAKEAVRQIVPAASESDVNAAVEAKVLPLLEEWRLEHYRRWESELLRDGATLN